MLRFSDIQVFVFDLDDTLYKEIDYVKSAYRHLANQIEIDLGKDLYPEMWDYYQSGLSTLDIISQRYPLKFSVEQMVSEYRYHEPQIKLSRGVAAFLTQLQNDQKSMGIVTDGRSRSQRNKIRALGIESYFEHIVISEEFGSEKPSEGNFLFFNKIFPEQKFAYIADNPAKDFITPNQLGWLTVAIEDDGQNIHKSTDCPLSYRAQRSVRDFLQLGKEYLLETRSVG